MTRVNDTVRMESEIKAHVEELDTSLGMNVPNQETIEALEEAKEMLRTGNFKRYTVDEAFEELEKECCPSQ